MLQFRVRQRAFVGHAHGILEWLAVEVRDDFVAGVARLLARALLQAVPELAHVAARLACRVPEDLLVLGGEAFPRADRHDKYLGAHRVLGQGIIRGEPVVASGDIGRPVVLGAVDQPGRKAGRHLAVGQFDRFGAQRLDHVEHQVGLLDANAQALHVRERPHRPDAVVDRARAGVVEGQADKTVARETAQDLFADRPVKHVMQVGGRAEQEGQGEHIGGRDQRADRRHIGAIEIDRTHPGLLDCLFLFAELAGMEYLDTVAATGALLDQAGHIEQRLHGRVVRRLGVGDPKIAPLRGGDQRRQGDPADPPESARAASALPGIFSRYQ